MIMYNEEKNLLKITIPLSGVKELENSQDGISGIYDVL